MKIDESCIDHSATKIIDEYMGDPCEYSDQQNDCDHMRLITIGYVRGVLELAKELKEELKK